MTPNAETVTRLEVELLRRIRTVDGGACLVDILLGDDEDLTAMLMAAMREAAP